MTLGDGTTSADKDKRLAGALRQQAINDVLLEYAGRQDKALIVSALTAALTQRGLSTPTPEWLEGVATDVALGHTYVVSPDSLRGAAALELPDDPHFVDPEPKFTEPVPGPPTSPGAGDSQAEQPEEEISPSSQPRNQSGAGSTTRNRDRLVATVLVVVGVAVWTRALRSRGRDTPAESTGQ